MSTDRLSSYLGYIDRYWALRIEQGSWLIDSRGRIYHPYGVTPHVHHFRSQEDRDGWVSMDPDLRVAVDKAHPSVRAWLRADPNYRPKWYEKITDLWLASWARIARIGR